MNAPQIGPFAPLAPEIRRQSLIQTLAGKPDEIWVFAYGSLMWDSGFAVAERRPATLRAYRRSFCVWTAHARGTPDNPGLGLGLLPQSGAACRGVALRIAPAALQGDLEALWLREMWTGVYFPSWVMLEIGQGRLPALAFVVDTAHPQYAAGLSVAATAERIAAARGVFGACRNYFDDTVKALRNQGIDAGEFDQIGDAIAGLTPRRD